MRADAKGTEMVEARKDHRARLAVSLVLALALAIVVVPVLFSAAAPWGLIAAAVGVAIVAGVDSALVLDKMLNGPREDAAPEQVLEPAA